MEKIPQKTPFDSMLTFVEMLHAFRAVERNLLSNGMERNENDVEHSFTLAMLAWYVNATYDVGLDTEKLLKYALVHDLVEVYAGDTYLYSTEERFVASKHEREEEALIRLKKEFAEFPEQCTLIAEYEKREDRESRFVYALDKVEPALSIYLDGGRTWKRDSVTLTMIKEKKLTKVALDPTVERIFKELLERIVEKEDVLCCDEAK